MPWLRRKATFSRRGAEPAAAGVPILFLRLVRAGSISAIQTRDALLIRARQKTGWKALPDRLSLL